jgi:hypothetical protein
MSYCSATLFCSCEKNAKMQTIYTPSSDNIDLSGTQLARRSRHTLSGIHRMHWRALKRGP